MDLNELLSRMALELHEAEGSEATGETISEYARLAVGADQAGIMIVRGKGVVETPAETDSIVDDAHQLQAVLDEGPCLDTVRGGEPTHLVNDTASDPRWPKWGPRAAEMGFLSTIGAAMETRARTVGALNVYARRKDAFTERDVEVVKWLASHASVALAAADEKAGLRVALTSRTMIGQAEGILMHALAIDENQAFAYMQRLSQDTNEKLVNIARSIVEKRDRIREGGPAEL